MTIMGGRLLSISNARHLSGSGVGGRFPKVDVHLRKSITPTFGMGERSTPTSRPPRHSWRAPYCNVSQCRTLAP